jgi:hypothetical protein
VQSFVQKKTLWLEKVRKMLEKMLVFDLESDFEISENQASQPISFLLNTAVTFQREKA